MSSEQIEHRRTIYESRVREVYPDLVMPRTTLIRGNGQNNDVLIVDEALIFRFPRYAASIARLERAQAILRRIQPFITLPIPSPAYWSFDQREVGKVFVGYPRIPGEPLSPATLDAIDDERILQQLADQVARILRQLHQIPVDRVIPGALASFQPLTVWEDLYARIRRKLFRHMRPDARDSVARHFEAFLDDRANRLLDPALIHGDFGGSNLLFDSRALTITGVIDFAAARCFGHQRLSKVYPEIQTALDRVRFYTGTFALQEALFGVENGESDAFQRGIAPYV